MAKPKATNKPTTEGGKAKAKGKDNAGAKERLAELSMPPTLTLKVGEQTILATAKEFASGSVGYYANGKINVGDDGYPCQVGCSIVAVKTKG